MRISGSSFVSPRPLCQPSGRFWGLEGAEGAPAAVEEPLTETTIRDTWLAYAMESRRERPLVRRSR